MSIKFKLLRVVTLRVAVSLFCLLRQPGAFADSVSVSQWESVNSERGSCVQILLREEHRFEPHLPTFVITHGMGGTMTGDRFHQLAEVIDGSNPDCNVILLDWSDASLKKTAFLGLPSPWEVARNIDVVAKEAAESLHVMGIESSTTTFIGESFGNCVNARIAEHLGRHGRILAFNPPNAAGGYKTPDLRTCADQTWSFHTFSVFDAQDPIAHAGFFLETPANATDLDQHVAGVSWLVDQVRSGNTKWLLLQHHMKSTSHDEFDAIAAISGELIQNSHLSRERSPESRAKSRTFSNSITRAL